MISFFRKTLLVSASFVGFIGAVTVSTTLHAQCDEIFMSEVCEGSGNNKGIEFFNPTNAPIDLSAYRIQRWANGVFAVSDETQLTGVIPALGTWVLVNGQTEDVPLGGGAVSPLVDPIMQGYADQLDNPYQLPPMPMEMMRLCLSKKVPTERSLWMCLETWRRPRRCVDG